MCEFALVLMMLIVGVCAWVGATVGGAAVASGAAGFATAYAFSDQLINIP